MTRTKSTTLFGMAIGCIGMIASIILLSTNAPNYYNALPLIPFTYGLLSILFGKMFSRSNMENICVVMFSGVMFLRTVLLPVLLASCGYYSSKTINIESNMPKAILLFTYEMITLYIVLDFLMKKRTPHSNSWRQYVQDDLSESSTHYASMVILLLFALLFCFFLAPSSIGYYRPIFGINNFEYTGFDSRDLISHYATSVTAKFGLVTFRYIANVCRLVLPAVMLVRLKKKNVPAKYARLVAVLLIFVFDLLLVDDTIATSVVNGLITLIFYNRIYSNPRKIFVYFAFAAGAIIAYFMMRIGLTSTMGTSSSNYLVLRFSNYAQAYFGGINNIAGGFNLSVPDFFERSKYLIYEFLKGVPYANTIFGLDSTNIAQLYNSVNRSSGQIVPVISSGCLYYSPFFAPIYSVIFLFISYKASEKTLDSNKPLRVLSSISICIYSLMGTSMYSGEATWAFIFTIGVPIYLLSRVFE